MVTARPANFSTSIEQFVLDKLFGFGLRDHAAKTSRIQRIMEQVFGVVAPVFAVPLTLPSLTRRIPSRLAGRGLG
jgi:hypothetical protein